ncbi:TraU family protein [Sulfurospirillum multivorans]|nr:TraU family protein [Sulfurospirillum multivorans]QEH06500.1 IncF plasmid conjugative transfer pilus assembly protein TraU [Sulfurospirillum multivorans]
MTINKKFLHVTFAVLLFSSSLIARTGGEVYKFYKNIDYDFFFDKLEVSFDICKCEIETSDQWLAGFKYTLVEPIGFIESSITPMHFVGLDIKTADAKKLMRKQGTSRKGDDSTTFRHAHFIIFPVLGYTLGLVQDFFCFERASVFNMAYISEVIPSHNNDLVALAEETVKPVSKIWFANPVAEAACGADCASSTAGYPINSLYWCDGCRGSVTGSDTGWSRASEPLEDTESVAFRVINRMHAYSGMLKTKESTFAYNPVGSHMKSSMCEARYFPVIVKDQYYLQLAKEDKSWDAKNFGKIRFQYDFKTDPTDEDSVFFWLWRERNMCGGAAKCRSTFNDQ